MTTVTGICSCFPVITIGKAGVFLWLKSAVPV